MSTRARNREICADCSAPDSRWASINRGVLICDECCSIHRGLGRHSSQVRHLTQTPWPSSQLQMVKSLVTAKDLSKQLHSSVRTGNLETCLRLLSLGAQANFFHPEKGNTPLHVAAKAGQLLQAELLTVYGADPGAPDSSGKNPIDYARQAGHQELADRLVEIQFELTDRLAFYLCGRKPDHKNSQHFIIPQIGIKISLILLELQLSNHQFEELAMDVYDEVDRRETDAVWLATQNHSTLVTDTTVVPFLPVNPEYSSTRNQGRQKLARFNAHEFATLVVDILTDAKRRQQGNSPDNFKDNVELILKDIGNHHGSESPEMDQPDYDSVASDEDTEQEPTSGKDERTKSSDLSDSPITVQELMEVKSALTASEAKIQQLLKVNCHLGEELRLMQSKLNSLQNENSTLKTPNSLARPQDLPHRAPPRGCRAMSMYETGSGLRQYHPRGETVCRDTTLTLQPLPSNGPSVTAFSSLPTFPSTLSWSWDEITQRGSTLDAQSGMPESDYDNALNHVEMDESGSVQSNFSRASGWPGDGTVSQSENPSEGECDSSLPCTEDVISKTELITKNIQELLRAAQENKHESFVPCSERILVAVTEMATLFPKRPSSESVRGSLRLLTSSASRLQGECQKATPHDSQQVIQCAYDIAKAAKQLVTVTTKDSN
uniref:G protein-coupled receptor kinase interacting ArfGAP 2b n=1 Tax=Sinocyclocheilus rhinocerous TaxID=307959 RepID=A0A673MH77_9TELE